MPRSYEQNYQIIKYAASNHPMVSTGVNLDLQTATSEIDTFLGDPVCQHLTRSHTVLEALTHLEAYEDVFGVTGGTADIARLLNATGTNAIIRGVKTVPSITFGQSTLNYYDEGTWTPSVLRYNSSELISAITVAVYTRIGKMVFFNTRFNITDVSDSPDDPFTILGLPFTTGDSSSQVYIHAEPNGPNGNEDGGFTLIATVVGTTIQVLTTGSVPVYCSDFGTFTNKLITVHGCYFIAADAVPAVSHRTYEQAYQVLNTAATANIGLTGANRTMEEIMVAGSAFLTGWVSQTDWSLDCIYATLLHGAISHNAIWTAPIYLPDGMRNSIGFLTTSILNCYEEGSWVPVDVSGDSLVFTTVHFARYIKMGDTVYFNLSVTYPTTSSSSGAIISGPPFECAHSGQCWASATTLGYGIYSDIILNHPAVRVDFNLYKFSTAPAETTVTNINISARRVTLSGCYRAA